MPLLCNTASIQWMFIFERVVGCRFGTLEELMEVVTWTQLGHHKKAVGILNINGFYDHLLTFLSSCEAEVCTRTCYMYTTAMMGALA